jgi:DNA transformation protein and related proteins
VKQGVATPDMTGFAGAHRNDPHEFVRVRQDRVTVYTDWLRGKLVASGKASRQPGTRSGVTAERSAGQPDRWKAITKRESLDMRVNSSLASYVTEHLAFLGHISNRPIFGGVGIFIDERLLGIVINETLYLHTDRGNLDDYLSRGMAQFKPYPNAFDLTTDHHQVPLDILEDPPQLKIWGQRALTAAIEAARVKQLAGIERARHAKQAKKKAKEHKEQK